MLYLPVPHSTGLVPQATGWQTCGSGDHGLRGLSVGSILIIAVVLSHRLRLASGGITALTGARVPLLSAGPASLVMQHSSHMPDRT